MDDQIIQLLRDQFQQTNEKIDQLYTTMSDHIKQDNSYWTKIEQTEGQIRLLKWAAGAGPVGAIVVWAYSKLGGH